MINGIFFRTRAGALSGRQAQAAGIFVGQGILGQGILGH
jgi:hypothetical protein